MQGVKRNSGHREGGGREARRDAPYVPLKPGGALEEGGRRRESGWPSPEGWVWTDCIWVVVLLAVYCCCCCCCLSLPIGRCCCAAAVQLFNS